MDALVQIAGNSGERAPVFLDERGGQRTREVELAREPHGAHTVENAEIDDLGLRPLGLGDVFGRHAEEPRGRGAVHVLSGAERLREHWIARQVRHETQLDLRVIKGDQKTRSLRDEGLSDRAALL